MTPGVRVGGRSVKQSTPTKTKTKNTTSARKCGRSRLCLKGTGLLFARVPSALVVEMATQLF